MLDFRVSLSAAPEMGALDQVRPIGVWLWCECVGMGMHVGLLGWLV